jgi:hypothetical protein
VWRDERVLEQLQHFVPCADEVWRLQNLDEPDCKHFQSFCDDLRRLNAHGDTVTRQGTYCVTPSGVLLGSANTRDPAHMAELLRTSLEKWNAMPREERLLAFDPALVEIERAENRYPSDGLVLRVVSRDLPREPETREPNDWRTHAWNFDHAWFSREEVERLVPREFEVGGTFACEPALVRRLVRLHLVDNVRGQTMGYAERDVAAAELTATVAAIDGAGVTLTLNGRASQGDRRHDHDGSNPAGEPSRGVEVTLFGSAVFDTQTRRFTTFDVVAVGTRFGATRYNERHDDRAPTPIGFHLHLAVDHPTTRIAPAEFWEYGWR